MIFTVNVLMCSGCYLLDEESLDVLKDKFHTTVDKLTRFCLCCCSSLIPELLCRPFHLGALTLVCP